MSILKEHISQLEKDQLNFHQSELTSFFLIALDFRAEHSGVSSVVLCAPGTIRCVYCSLNINLALCSGGSGDDGGDRGLYY